MRGSSLTEAYFGSFRFSRTFRQIQSRVDYDVCLAVCSSMGAYALNGSQTPRTVVDMIDVDSAKWKMYAGRCRGPFAWIYGRESEKIASLERRLVGRAATTVVISRHERDVLRAVECKGTTLAIPNGVDVEYFAPLPEAGPGHRLVFVGQMDYFPNIDAVVWFAERVWPELARRFPSLQWSIVGRRPARAVRRLRKVRNVTVTGGVEDVRPYLGSAIAIAPLRVACGVQNKVLEAMAMGRAVVASPAAACGLDVRPQEELLVADNPKQWVSAVDLVLTDAALASGLGVRARQAMLERFTWSRAAVQMVACLTDAKVNAHHAVGGTSERELAYQNR